MDVYSLPPRAFASNCYLLVSNEQAALVDPGSNAKAILRKLEESGARLAYILLTHAHFDHMGAVREVLQKFPVPVYLHESERDFPGDPAKNAAFLIRADLRFPAPDRFFAGGEEIPLGKEHIKVLHTPGHTAGSCCFLAGEHLVTGDTLFADGVGRTDLYSGDANSLLASLISLKNLSDNLTVYPGHGASATLGEALRRASLWL